MVSGENRIKFGDTACFETVHTDSKGTATVKFKLPDNVTTYRITAHAANEDMYVGVNTSKITSTLDFFIQSTEPRKVKTSDDLVLNATSISDTNYNVDYEFTIAELNKTMKCSEQSNNIATVNYGKLKAGKYHVIIKGKHEAQEDGIEYDFEIVESAQEVYSKETLNINDNTVQIKPTKNPITLELYNKNMEQYLKYIEFIENTYSSRLDTRISYNEIQKIKNQYYKTNYQTNVINIDDYINKSENDQLCYIRFKNNINGQDSILLTALIEYYTKEYNLAYPINLQKDDNVFEYYLYLSAKNEPVLQDLKYLKDAQKDITTYNKLILTLSFEFIGDYQNAKELYSNININDKEKEEYASIIALIDTFINKKEAANKINNIIENNPSDEYVRFAILSFFENNSKDIEKEETVTITSNNVNDTITINGLEVKKYTIYNDDLDIINFNSSSNDLKVSYYYQTALENIQDKNIKKDIKIDFKGTIKKNNVVYLNINFSDTSEGEVKITLPNSLRLAQINNDSESIEKQKYFISTNNIDNLSLYKLKECKTIKLPLIVTAEGEYTLESIVNQNDGIYHISNSLKFTATK